MAEPILEVENLNCAWSDLHVVHDVSFTLEEDETAVIFGLNGVGKTTLMHGIVNDPTMNRRVDSIRLFGNEVSSLKTQELVKKRIALIPQDGGLFPEMTVCENFELPFHKILGGSQDEFEENIRQIVDIFPKIEEILDRQVGKCSGGEKKMTMIGRGLIVSPDILLIDEPTAALSPNLRNNVLRAISQNLDMPAIVTLPLMAEIEQVLQADQEYIMKTGELFQTDEVVSPQ